MVMSISAIVLSVALLGSSLAAMGCRSAGEPGRSVPAVPAAQPAFTAPTDTQASPVVIWVPEWQMYLRDGDVVYDSGWYYSYRAGQWYVSRSDNGPWTAVVTGEARARDQRRPQADARTPGTSARASSLRRQRDGASGREAPRGSVEKTASRVVSVALQHVGAPYRWGGADPRGFDCSGFVMYVYGKAGTSLPHGAVKQYSLGVPVSRSELEPGDIVFFDRLRHNGIYIGDGRFIHSSKTGDVVRVSRLDEDWFERRWVGARRLAIAAGAEIRRD